MARARRFRGVRMRVRFVGQGQNHKIFGWPRKSLGLNPIGCGCRDPRRGGTGGGHRNGRFQAESRRVTGWWVGAKSFVSSVDTVATGDGGEELGDRVIGVSGGRKNKNLTTATT